MAFRETFLFHCSNDAACDITVAAAATAASSRFHGHHGVCSNLDFRLPHNRATGEAVDFTRLLLYHLRQRHRVEIRPLPSFFSCEMSDRFGLLHTAHTKAVYYWGDFCCTFFLRFTCFIIFNDEWLGSACYWIPAHTILGFASVFDTLSRCKYCFLNSLVPLRNRNHICCSFIIHDNFFPLTLRTGLFFR